MNDNLIFRDRKDAGQRLASFLLDYKEDSNTIILSLPRGGVPVAYEIATKLKLPMDVFIVRKLGVPNYKEFAMGAIASGGVKILNQPVINQLGISQAEIDEVLQRELEELNRRALRYRQGRSLPQISGSKVILVDDGIATGSTIKAALVAIRKLDPEKIIVAVPVAPASSIEDLENYADEIICLEMPRSFSAIGEWYEDFSQTSDEEVCEILDKSR